MSLWVVGMLVGLPFSVWLLAILCAVIDEPHPAAALVRLTLVLCVVLGVLLLTDRAYIYPLLTSFVIVVALHTLSFVLTVNVATGIPIYEYTPPDPPLLEEGIEQIDEQIE